MTTFPNSSKLLKDALAGYDLFSWLKELKLAG